MLKYKWFAVFVLALFGASAFAQPSYPSKPIRIIVPFVPGGPTDVLARAVAPELSQSLGVPVIIENKGGAGGGIGMEMLAKAAPDGYSLVLGLTGTNSINPYLYSKLPYDPIKSFAPVAPLVSFVNAFMCTLKLPVTNVAELVAYAKANPNAISSGSGGNGTTAHLSLEVLKFISGAPIQHIPYKGTSPAMNDVIGGNLSCMFDVLATSIPQIKAGTVKALAVTGGTRSRYLPEVPTMTESGLPGYDETVSDLWYGLFAPAGTPQAIVERLNTEVDQAMSTSAVKERMAAQGFERLKMSPEEFAVFLRADLDKWGKVVKAAGIRAE